VVAVAPEEEQPEEEEEPAAELRPAQTRAVEAQPGLGTRLPMLRVAPIQVRGPEACNFRINAAPWRIKPDTATRRKDKREQPGIQRKLRS